MYDQYSNVIRTTRSGCQSGSCNGCGSSYASLDSYGCCGPCPAVNPCPNPCPLPGPVPTPGPAPRRRPVPTPGPAPTTSAMDPSSGVCCGPTEGYPYRDLNFWRRTCKPVGKDLCGADPRKVPGGVGKGFCNWRVGESSCPELGPG